MAGSSLRNLWKRNLRSTCEGGNPKLPLTYSGIPKSVIKKDSRKENIRKWQGQWVETRKGVMTKNFFPSVEIGLAVKIEIIKLIIK